MCTSCGLRSAAARPVEKRTVCCLLLQLSHSMHIHRSNRQIVVRFQCIDFSCWHAVVISLYVFVLNNVYAFVL